MHSRETSKWYNEPWLATVAAICSVVFLSMQIKSSSEDTQKMILSNTKDTQKLVHTRKELALLEINIHYVDKFMKSNMELYDFVNNVAMVPFYQEFSKSEKDSLLKKFLKLRRKELHYFFTLKELNLTTAKMDSILNYSPSAFDVLIERRLDSLDTVILKGNYSKDSAYKHLIYVPMHISHWHMELLKTKLKKTCN